MDARTWAATKGLLTDVASTPAAEREQFILDRCDDPALREELLQLIGNPDAVSDLITRPTLAPGTRLGVYVVETLLGRGGMGDVYRARDPRLDRGVALKILPAGIAANATWLERFSREARALAALNHPNIVTIYSTEEFDGTPFLTMELVEGRALDRMIPKTGLPVAALLEIAVPLCDAIAAAHDKHLTHRDLKPANVVVSSDGRVKVLDFGLAAFCHSERDQTDVTPRALTHQGTVLGTAPYMSPEQVEGKTVDHRTDIFSLGIMLYEMAVGARPFLGDSSLALMSAILKDTPPALRDVRPEIPGELARLVARCLEKDPRDRVQTARDVFNELGQLRRELSAGTHGPSSPAPVSRSRYPMVAVAAFDAHSAGNDAQTLAEGLTDDISAALSRFSYLRVGPKTDAQFLIEGTVRRVGSSLRITARLVDMAGVHLWAETFNRATDDDPFALQDELTSRIVATVADPSGVLVRSMAATLSDRPYAELTATELVLRHYIYLEQYRPDEHARLREALERAVTREPGHADAWAALSHLYSHEYVHGFNPRPDAVERQRRAAERAIELDPMSQRAWLAMTRVHFNARDLTALRATADRSIALNPLNTFALASTAIALAWAGDWERGIELARRAMTYNPHHAGEVHFVPCSRFLYLRQFEEALAEAKRFNMPHHQSAQFFIATIAGHLGRRAEAQAAIDALRRINPTLLDPDAARQWLARWNWDDELTTLQIDGLRKALALVDTPPESSSDRGTGTAK
jgi:serine/threonine protein kinase/tetratricopeptide (TPR) repeat protein